MKREIEALSDTQTQINLDSLVPQKVAGEARNTQELAVAEQGLAVAKEARQNSAVSQRAVDASSSRFEELDLAAQTVMVEGARVRILEDQLAFDQKERTLQVNDRRQLHWSRKAKYIGAALATAATLVVSNTQADHPDTSHFNNPVFAMVNNAWDDVTGPLTDQATGRASEAEQVVAAQQLQAERAREVAADTRREERAAALPKRVVDDVATTQKNPDLGFDQAFQIASQPVNGERLELRCNDGVYETANPVTEPANVEAFKSIANVPCTILPGRYGYVPAGETGRTYRVLEINDR